MRETDVKETEAAVGRLLQIGVLFSAAVILLGFIMFLATGDSGYANDAYPTSLPLILSGVLALKPYAVILMGLFILILTPVFRVGVSIIIFLKQKDYLYVKITALVFAILIVSFLLGKVE